MSKIGEYVHYKLINYQKFGITREEIQSTSGISQANEAFSTQKKAIKHFLKEKDLNLKEIENRLTEMHGFLTSTDSNVQDSDQSKILKELVDQFAAKLEGKIDRIDYNTLTVYANSGFSESQYQKIVQNYEDDIKKFKKNKMSVGTKTHKTINQETIRDRIRVLNNLKRTLIKDLGELVQAKELIDLINDINVIYTRDIFPAFKQAKGVLPRDFKGLSEERGLIPLINQAFSEIKRKQIPNESGKLAELVAAISLNMNTLQLGLGIKEAVAKFIQDIEGSVTYKKGYIKSNFGNMEFAKNKLGETATITLPDTNVKVEMITDIKHKGQQGKIDFRFTDLNKGFGNVGISHKAYFLKDQSNIHINSGGNLLLMMQEYPDFSNHYLNVMASHPDNGSVSNLSTIRGLAKEALKLTILAYSLSGGFVTDRGIMDKAEVLTVFNKSTQRYHAFSIHSILNRASENIEKYLDLEDDLKELNNEGNNAVSRISGLLAQLRTASIKASIKKEALGFK